MKSITLLVERLLLVGLLLVVVGELLLAMNINS
jgi:hypothetical protein